MSEDSISEFFDKFKQFCVRDREFGNLLKEIKLEDSTSLNLIFHHLGVILLQPKHTFNVINSFRPELLTILCSAISFQEESPTLSYSNHVRICVVLSKAITLHPDVQNVAVEYFQKYPAPFEDYGETSKVCPPRKKFKIDDCADVSSDIVSACYDLLCCKTEFFKAKWSWATFMEKYYNHSDDMIKWKCFQCIRIVTGMNEVQFSKLLLNYMSENSVNNCLFEYEFNNSEEQTAHHNGNEYQLEVVSKNTVCIDGIYLPILQEPKESSEIEILPVETTKSNLHKVAIGIAANRAVCLQGPVGSGKTFLVEYLASITGRILGDKFIKVQLSDQTDSKMLLGTCRCTDIPGEFEWQPGVLTQAVMEGNWLLLEDIDLASMDIASVLTALLENRCLTVPGYRDSLPIAPGFQLFVTQRLLPSVTGFHKKQSNVITLLEKNILQINIIPLSWWELENIVQTIYPPLKTVASRMVAAFLLFSSNTSRSGRLVSARDLFKWCKRSALNFDVTSQNSALNVLQNAIDIFCCSFSNTEDRFNLASKIGSKLGIISEKADYYCNRYKPQMSLTTDSLTSSRVSIPKQSLGSNVRMNFCFTRPAVCLLERIMCSINMKEPVLLVGETGTGKTLAVQYLAHTIGVKLVVINMNQQSDSADLLGGYKPVDLKFVISPIKREFEEVFGAYFNVAENKKFLMNVNYCFNEAKWGVLIKLMQKSLETAVKRLTEAKENVKAAVGLKRKHQDSSSVLVKKNEQNEEFLNKWLKLGTKLQKLEVQIKHKNSLAFSFIEGSLVKAVTNGYWVLLDEINLANAETLECLSGLLEGNRGSINLLERGDKKPIKRHSQFTLFACMNPSTDVGKRDLPTGLRNRFTEFYMDELLQKSDLVFLVNNYLTAMSLPQEKLENIVKFYLRAKVEAEITLCDGIGQKPYFSLRTLCRALTIAARNPCGVFNRSLFEAFCLSFLTQLDSKSYQAVEKLIVKFILGNAKNANSVLKQSIAEPTTEKCLNFEGYWVTVGHLEPEVPNNYILTESVRRNLRDLVRVVSIGKSPVLLQGDTSVGKTSLIKYLAQSSGNKCVRINNHEHTDLQEYIGSYVADVSGKLIFREGLLVEAMRDGHWIILDELNLAPTDVLEALNRVLDDNRELFIPETQKTIKAHPNFMLFATQNPPGLYGGRKILSRAFRNRFVELHFNDIPSDELEFILHKRCEMPPTYSKKMVAVMNDLQTRRRGSAAFAGKQGFITLRDLFRWGERYRLAKSPSKLYDWDQHLADEGYLLLAGRVRKVKERDEIVEVLQKQMNRRVLPLNLFTLSNSTSAVTRHILQRFFVNKDKHKNIVWTYNMCQLGVLVAKALEFHEPVLLVGETGGGKTTICKLIAEINNQKLLTVNCHMHTESSDFIGGLRPVREHSEEDLNRLFEWVDGPLIQAMVKGDVFLADEISLADDSVLERLNSLLEPERLLLLAEKGADTESTQLVAAHKNFHFIGTMNPGGDHGKKELSLALRNRFTEIWCESCTDRDDLIKIIEHNLWIGVNLGKLQGDIRTEHLIMNFIEWFRETQIGKRFTVSIRDILTWVNFINCSVQKIGISDAYSHGACLTFLDSFGSGVTSTYSTTSLESFKKKCLKFIWNQLASLKLQEPTTLRLSDSQAQRIDDTFGIKPFYLKAGNYPRQSNTFIYDAPTCLFNTLRLLRGLQLNKAILLEGSPGVGKTSMVTALATSTDNRLLRINLSDQTDISDLFGADLPVEGGTGGQFAWRDGPFLQALKKGYWILLDELNLASQSVLEGLNACLDHRGEVFIPELGKTFYIKEGTRLFASQNPLKQGGSRRGLPQSFLNRFTQVYIDPLNELDLLFILTRQFPSIPKCAISKMLAFNTKVVNELETHSFGHRGSPWEFNLRDMTRWCEAIVSDYDNCKPENLVQLIYCDRMRTKDDKIIMSNIFEEVFGRKIGGDAPMVYVTQNNVQLGDVNLKKEINGVNLSVLKQEPTCLVLRTQVAVLRSLAYCVKFNWMAILVGCSGSGKSCVVRTLANLVGKTLHTLPVTSSMDTTDILGGFEQVDYTRHLEELIRSTEIILLDIVQKCVVNRSVEEGCKILRMWENLLNFQQAESENRTMAEETQIFLKRLQCLETIWIALTSCNVTPLNLKYKIKLLSDKGKIINQVVRKEGNLNAGGKFEWVDSILIKCLQEGSWLLIDNVNLCSPAVLDRLNALLEPNGVLTIGERGVKENGEMVEIVPHRDFRLFLTMDPKNGEISRAMRNRGIEIFMLNESELEVRNFFDFKSLISLAGLKDNKHTDTLLTMHDFISSFVLGEKPDVNSLLQASFLISQELLRGRNVFKAFYEALVDVYYQTRSPNEFDASFSLELLQGRLKESTDLRNSILQFYDDDVTMKTSLLTKQSQIEQIKQQGTLIRQLPLSSYKYVLINNFTMTNKTDLEARCLFAENVLQSEQVNKQFSFARKLLNDVQTSNPNIPYDPHWTPDSNQDNVFKSNQLYLAFFHYSSSFVTEHRRIKKNTELTLGQFLKGILDNQVEPKTEEPLERKLLQILNIFDDTLLKSLLSTPVQITDEETIEAMSLIRWRFVLDGLLRANIKRKDLPQYRALLTNLRVHYKWFLKFSVGQLYDLLNCKPEKLQSAIADVYESELDDSTALKKFAKSFQKRNYAPPPLVNRIQIETHSIVQELFKKYDVYNKNFNKVILLDTSLRHGLLDIKADLMYEFSEKPKVLAKIVNHQPKDVKLFELELLPVFDYLARLAVVQLKLNFECAESESKILFEVPTIPSDLTGVIVNYLRTRDQRYLHEVKTGLFTHLLKSASANPHQLFASKEGLEKQSLSSFAPILSVSMTNLLVSGEESKDVLKVTKYGNYRDAMDQHKTLSLVFWRNMDSLWNEKFDFIYCEHQYLKRSLYEFVSKISQCLNLEYTPETFNELTEVCIDKIKAIPSSRLASENAENPIAVILTKCLEETNILDLETDFDKNIKHISNVYILLNYIKALLNSKLPLIDPHIKTQFKSTYCSEEINEFVHLIHSYQTQNSILSCSKNTVHSYVGWMEKKLQKLSDKRNELDKYRAVRPRNESYSAVTNEISHHFSVILSPSQVLKSSSNLDVAFDEIRNAINTRTPIELTKYDKFANECSQNIWSYEKLIEVLKTHRYNYPDVIEPLLNNLVEFLYGFRLKLDLHNKLLSQYKNALDRVDLNSSLVKMLKFPVLDEFQQDYLKVINSYTNLTWRNFVVQTLQGDENNFSKQENFRLLKCGLLELSNYLLLIGQNYKNLDEKLFESFDSLLSIFVGAWKKQEEEREAKKKADESLYKMKSKTEDEEVEENFNELFPNFHDKDFSDMQVQMLGDDEPEMDLTPSTSYVGVITNEDVKFVSDLHSQLLRLYTRTEWLNPHKNTCPLDFLTPLVCKFKLFKILLDKYGKHLNYTMDNDILSSLGLLIAISGRFGNVSLADDQIKTKRNFYKDSNVEEVKGSFHILDELRLKIEQLLTEWPGHPGLQTIKTIIDRIYGFDITSPLSRFLTGFEILLTKCHDWEQNAHSGVSLWQYIQNLIHQIIAWRKIEMGVWKESLNDAFDRMNNPLQKWWFYLYEVMTQFTTGTESNLEGLISTLQKFITSSNLAEFAGRLSLLLTFHCHAVHLERCERTDQFICVLWNIHEYFKQFLPNVEAKIKELRSPIEKKLKDYIKIVKWKDISYWAIKETLEKTHKTLHKHIRDFEHVLNQPVGQCLVNTTSDSITSVGIWDRPQRQSPKKYHYTMAAESYIAKRTLSSIIEKSQNDPSILSKSQKYFLRSRRLCKEIILSTKYPTLIQSLDGFVTEIIENSRHLQSLEVDNTLPKNKQKAQAKGILQQKRKALSDLFKKLSEIGLSFRTGIMHSKIKKNFEQFVIKPIDLKASFGRLNQGKDEKILTIWEGCEMYFLKVLMRSDNLESSLLNPAKDLGMQNTDRCRGFSEHLLKMIVEQKQNLIETSRVLYYLKFYLNCITAHYEEESFISIDLYSKVQSTLKNILVIMEQCKIIIQTSPAEFCLDPLQHVPMLEREKFLKNKNLQSPIKEIEIITSTTKKLISNTTKFESKIPSANFEFALPLNVPISNIDSLVQDLDCLSANLVALSVTIRPYLKTKSIDWLCREVEKITLLLGTCSETRNDKDSRKLKIQTEQFLEKVLIVVQNVYKKYNPKDYSRAEKLEEDIDNTELKPSHLKTLIVEDLLDDMFNLQMRAVLNNLHGLIKIFYKTKSTSIFAQVVPFLHQLILLYEYFVTQQVSAYRVTCKMSSILINIFIDLTTRGFCIPPEFSEELTSGSEGQNLTGGMGLGEGEGEKDVSDKIESEDQLEDAQPVDKEKKEKEDDDCKEEDKGIEMSEDFESKLQDIEKGDDDDDENSDNDKDADEQMGETEKNADRLDQEIWGSENEDDNESENEEDKAEEKGSQGEKEGDNELSAKENHPKEEDRTDPSGEETKEKNKKEINEMEEPELDDQQVDPYHGNQPEYPEPEAMDLPEDLNLDDDAEDKDEQQDETNPFDIDTMKEQNPPENDEKNKDEKDKEQEPEESQDVDQDNQEQSDVKESEGVEEVKDQNDESEMEENDEQSPSEKKKDESEDKDETLNDEQPGLDQTHKNEEDIQAMDVDDVEAADNVESNQSKNQKPNQSNENCQEDNPDKKGVGQSHMEESAAGHAGQTDTQQDVSSGRDKNEKEVRRKPGESDSKRSLGDAKESIKKKLKTIDVQQNEQDEEDGEKQDAEMYKHIKEAKESDHQVLDAATKEQAEQQKISELKEDEEEPKDSTDIVPEDEEEASETNEAAQQKPEKLDSERKKISEKSQHPDGDIFENLQEGEVEGEVVETCTVMRGGETTHHTLYSNLTSVSVSQLSVQEMIQIRAEVEQQLSVWNETPTREDAKQTWEKISSLTSSLAQGLSEQLRLVLEPTQASRLKGEYRTGKRINMRKVIPYIASEFRKDKIWLRRTKPSKRDYLIALAIDDSSSMSDNHSKELAFESVALISKALTLLESGQLSVLSFGESTEILHKLTDTFTNESGVRLLQKFNFNQKKTCVSKLVEFASEMLSSAHSSSNALIAKLLIIVSDGRGIYSEGDYIQHTVRRAKLLNIFMVFVIVDNPNNKDSILDIRMPVFKDGKLLGIKSYMDAFPFPFYIILRDINSLPNVLSDALRQWFEIVASGDQQ